MVNPGNPTPRGLGVQLPNPERGGKLVFYDDCQRHTGWMFEYKGTGYAARLVRAARKPDSRSAQFMKGELAAEWLDQADRQVAASQGRPVIWVFAEKEARDFARELFDKPRNEKLKRIETEWEPWRETSK